MPMLARIGHTRRLDAQILAKSDIQAICAKEWDRLSASALEPNPFYSRRYVLAGLDTIDRETSVAAVSVRNEAGELVGLFPFRRRYIAPFPWSVARGAENSQQFCGVPLVARDGAPLVIDAWLQTLDEGVVPQFWALGNIPIEGPVARLINYSAAARGMKSAAVLPYERPYLTRHLGGFAGHCEKVVSRSRHQDINRNLRRLRELGEVTFERAVEPAEVAKRLEQFLEMERSGWKGRYGTAFLCNPDEADFARRALGDTQNPAGRSAIDSLLLDGVPIAMSVNLVSGRTMFTPKCTYDEQFRKYSPGLVLEYLIVERFHSDMTISEMDAATTKGGHVVQGLWNGRKPMGRLIVGPNDYRTDAIAKLWQAAHYCRNQMVGDLVRPLRSCMTSLKSRGALVKLHLTSFCVAGYHQKFMAVMETVQP